MNGKKTNGAEQAEGENRRRDERENEKPTTAGFKREERRGPAWRRCRKREFEGPEGSPRPAREAKFGRREKKRSQKKKGGLGGREPPRGKIGENPADGQKQTEWPGRRRQGKRGWTELCQDKSIKF